MNLRERSYGVLVVSASEKFNQALPEIFSPPFFSPVCFVAGSAAARRALTEREFDIAIVNSPLPDDSGVRLAVDSVSSGSTAVLFLARAEQYSEYSDRLSSNGVFVMQKPVSRSSFQLASEWLISARERIRGTERKAQSIEEKMNEIRIVNRAKWLLISELKMTEPDAHRFIEKQAMDRCIPKKTAAEEIINTYGR